MSPDIKLTEGESSYLKLIYRRICEESKEVGTTSIAEELGVRPATVTEKLQKLAEKEILEYEPYSEINLTEEGISKAQNLLRKHRLLEILFSEKFGYDPEEVCDEASKIDYHVSEKLANSICRAYGHPKKCPCAKRIYPDPECKGDQN